MCTCKNVGISLIDETTAEIRCAVHGPSFIYKYKGKWETAEQRMDRMKFTFICEACKQEETVYIDHAENRRYKHCAECANELQKNSVRKLKKEQRGRSITRSPWRKFVMYGSKKGV